MRNIPEEKQRRIILAERRDIARVNISDNAKVESALWRMAYGLFDLLILFVYKSEEH